MINVSRSLASGMRGWRQTGTLGAASCVLAWATRYMCRKRPRAPDHRYRSVLSVYATRPHWKRLWHGPAIDGPMAKWIFCPLAAANAYAIARNHPFTDGKKPAAWVLARLFLGLNEIRITFTPKDAIRMVWALAAGTLTEADVARWFKNRLA